MSRQDPLCVQCGETPMDDKNSICDDCDRSNDAALARHVTAPASHAEQRNLEAIGAQLALNEYSRAVDGLTVALSYAQAYEPPTELPDGYVTAKEFVRRVETLLEIARRWQ